MDIDIKDVTALSRKIGAQRLVIIAVDDDGYSWAAAGKPGHHEAEAKSWADANAEELAERLAGIHETAL